MKQFTSTIRDKTDFRCGWTNGCLLTIWTYAQWSNSRLGEHPDVGQLLQFYLPNRPNSASIKNVGDDGH